MSTSIKNTIGILLGIVLKLYMAFCSIYILTILIFPIHLFLSSISAISVLYISEQTPFTSVVKFITKYSIVFDAIVNEVNTFIFIFKKLLLVGRIIVVNKENTFSKVQ